MGESNIFEGKTIDCRDGYFSVETQMGRLSFAGEAESGTTVHVSLRPEQIRIGVPFQDGMIPLGEIKVKEVVFQGTHRLCHVMAGIGRQLELLLRLPQDQTVQTGDIMDIHARETDTVLLWD